MRLRTSPRELPGKKDLSLLFQRHGLQFGAQQAFHARAADHSLEQRFSNERQRNFAPEGHLAMSGEGFGGYSLSSVLLASSG